MELELINIVKYFGTIRANDGISLKIPAGTIQGILGENGAGKSTLMKIVSGYLRADRGEIRRNGRAARIETPADALALGIGMLYQDPSDFPPLTALENFQLGHPGGLFAGRRVARRELLDLAGQFDFDLDPGTYVDRLTVGERQQLEILRLLRLGVRLLILDEPTTGISAGQKEKLFCALARMAGAGLSVILVSHKLADVEQLCLRVAVLRQGCLVGEYVPPYASSQLVTAMFGKSVPAPARESVAGEQPRLTVKDLETEDSRLSLRIPDLTVRAGEVIGLAGLAGSGQAPFLRALAGLARPAGGSIRLDGRELAGQPYREFRRNGVAFLPAARLEEGLIPGLNVAEHVAVVQQTDGPLIPWGRVRAEARVRIDRFCVRGRPESPVESLSGGNQQRLQLALLRADLALLLLEYPTRGLDVESALYVWKLLRERCRSGAAILFTSADLDEILLYSDRVMVFFAGSAGSPLPAGGATAEQLGRLIGGLAPGALPPEDPTSKSIFDTDIH